MKIRGLNQFKDFFKELVSNINDKYVPKDNGDFKKIGDIGIFRTLNRSLENKLKIK